MDVKVPRKAPHVVTRVSKCYAERALCHNPLIAMPAPTFLPSSAASPAVASPPAAGPVPPNVGSGSLPSGRRTPRQGFSPDTLRLNKGVHVRPCRVRAPRSMAQGFFRVPKFIFRFAERLHPDGIGLYVYLCSRYRWHATPTVSLAELARVTGFGSGKLQRLLGQMQRLKLVDFLGWEEPFDWDEPFDLTFLDPADDQCLDLSARWFWINQSLVEEWLPRLGIKALTAYAALAYHADDHGRCSVTLDELAQLVGYQGRDSLRPHVQRLEQAGLVSVQEQYRHFEPCSTTTGEVGPRVAYQMRHQYRLLALPRTRQRRSATKRGGTVTSAAARVREAWWAERNSQSSSVGVLRRMNASWASGGIEEDAGPTEGAGWTPGDAQEAGSAPREWDSLADPYPPEGDALPQAATQAYPIGCETDEHLALCDPFSLL